MSLREVLQLTQVKVGIPAKDNLFTGHLTKFLISIII